MVEVWHASVETAEAEMCKSPNEICLTQEVVDIIFLAVFYFVDVLNDSVGNADAYQHGTADRTSVPFTSGR